MAGLMPPSATALERALDDLGQRPEAIPASLVAAMKHPQAAPPDLLAWLAWEYSVDEWPDDEVRRRRVIAASPRVHRVKGTLAALKTALGAAGYDAHVTEWFEATPPRRPYTLRLGLRFRDRSPDLAADRAQALRVFAAAKNLRTHLDGVDISVETRGVSPRLGAAWRMGRVVTLYPYVPAEVETRADVPAVAAAIHAAITITLQPGDAANPGDS